MEHGDGVVEALHPRYTNRRDSIQSHCPIVTNFVITSGQVDPDSKVSMYLIGPSLQSRLRNYPPPGGAQHSTVGYCRSPCN